MIQLPDTAQPPVGGLRHHGCRAVILAMVWGAMLVLPTGARGEAGAGAEDALPLPVMLREANVRLAPLSEQGLQKATQRLDQIVGTLSVPEELKSTQATGDAEPAEPTPAAVKAYIKGRAAMRQGNRWEAIRQLEQARRLDPTSADVLQLLGTLYVASGNTIKGTMRLNEAVRLEPDDAQTLYLLGRLAFEKGQWARAVVFLVRSQRIEAQQVDPATDYLRAYYLGQSLAQLGYDAAAIEQWRRFLKQPEGMRLTTSMDRQVALLDRQRDRVGVQIGDALARLGKPRAALRHYRWHSDTAQIHDDLILARRLYVLLTMRQAEEARSLLIEAITQPQRSARMLRLAAYLAEHTDDNEALNEPIKTLYHQQDRPAELALTLSDLLDDAAAVALLSEHLRARPHDIVVLYRLMDRLAKQAPDTLLKVVIRLIDDQRPNAGMFVQALVERDELDTERLLASHETLPAELRASTAGHYLRAVLLEASGTLDQAAEAYDKAIEADATFLAPQLASIELQLRRGRYGHALHLLEQLDQTADDPALRFTRAKVLRGLKRNDEARQIVDALIEAYPQRLEYLLFKGELLHRTRQYDQAAQVLEEARTLQPTHEPTYAALFALYSDPDNPTASATALGRTLLRAREHIPNSRTARLHWALQYQRMRQHNEAVRLLKALLADHPDDHEALGRLVASLAETGQWDKAEHFVLDLIRRRPDHEFAAVLIGQLAQRHIRNDDLDGGLQLLQRAIEAGSEHHIILRQTIAHAYLATGEPRQAIQQLDAVLKGTLSPTHRADLLCVKASCYTTLEQPNEAKHLLLKALEADADHERANNDLAYTWAEQNRNLERALAMSQLAVRSDPENPAYLDTLGWVYYKLRRFPEAAAQLRMAVAKPGGHDPIIRDHLGDVLWRLGRKAEAVRVWNQAHQAILQMGEAPDRADLKKLQPRLRRKLGAAAVIDKPPPIAPLPDEAPPPD